MVRRNALSALATLGETGELRAGGDPFLRPAVRASVSRSLEAARKVTRVDDSEHVARVAFLRESGLAQGLDPDDVPRVRALHEGAVEKLPRGSGPWPITMALLAVLAGALAFAVYKKFEPTAEERFRKSPFGVALGEPLAEFVVGLDRGTADKSVVLTPAVKKQLGEELFAELDDALTKTAARDASLQSSIDELNEGLARAKIPGYLDNYAHGDNVWLLSFFANDRADVALDGEKTHVAWGRRLDSLNLDTTFYVWMRAESRFAVVSLEMVESKFGKELLPTLGSDRPLFYGNNLGGANSTRLSKALAEPLRNAFIAETAVPLDELKTIWEIVATLEDATDRIKAKNGLLVAHGSLLVPPQELKRLEKYRGKNNLDLDDALKAHDRLVGHRAGLEKIVALAADVDEQTFVGEHLLLKKKAEPTDAAREAGISSAWGVAAARARLALLSDDKHAPVVYVEDMVRDIVVRGNGAVAVVVRELARELGRKLPEGTIESAAEALLNNVETIVSKPRVEVAEAARKVHSRLFGGSAPHYERAAL